MTSRIVQVGLLASYLRELVETDTLLQDVWVEGEVSAYTVAGSGHAYFSIKDEAAAVDCVMWRQTRLRQSFDPLKGDMVVVHGGATVYEKTSRFQIRADVIYPAGAGILQLQLEQLKQRLDAEGLFDPSRKRPLPSFPHRIGVVTSATGAVWHDIQHVLQRRYPIAELVLAPAMVQGESAPDSVTRAIERLQGEAVDVIIVARGGGSAEDLWAFNDERIARAVFASHVVVISAVGHETDTTLIDLVADVRAPTPSAAAELVAPDIGNLAQFVEDLDARLLQAARSEVERRIRDITYVQHRLALMSPKSQLLARRSALAVEIARIQAMTTRILERRGHDVERNIALLHALNPSSLLQRGYAFISLDSGDATVRSAGMLSAGERIRATFTDGSVAATVEDITITPPIS